MYTNIHARIADWMCEKCLQNFFSEILKIKQQFEAPTCVGERTPLRSENS